jgi:hypothetical protein
MESGSKILAEDEVRQYCCFELPYPLELVFYSLTLRLYT